MSEPEIKPSSDEEILAAKRAFLLGLGDLSWKLATAFLVPTGVGIATGYTIPGIIIGMIMAFLVIVQLARNSGVQK